MIDDNDSSAAQSNGDEEPDDTAEDSARQLALYDLNGDGKISVVESLRATVGLVDARMQSLAKRDGVLGKLATAAHRVLDRIDNDENPPKTSK
jgi:hypothetical protein